MTSIQPTLDTVLQDDQELNEIFMVDYTTGPRGRLLSAGIFPEFKEDLGGACDPVLVEAEVTARRERYLSTRTKLAHLPFQRTLEQFDFAFQPSIDQRYARGSWGPRRLG